MFEGEERGSECCGERKEGEYIELIGPPRGGHVLIGQNASQGGIKQRDRRIQARQMLAAAVATGERWTRARKGELMPFGGRATPVKGEGIRRGEKQEKETLTSPQAQEKGRKSRRTWN